VTNIGRAKRQFTYEAPKESKVPAYGFVTYSVVGHALCEDDEQRQEEKRVPAPEHYSDKFYVCDERATPITSFNFQGSISDQTSLITLKWNDTPDHWQGLQFEYQEFILDDDQKVSKSFQSLVRPTKAGN